MRVSIIMRKFLVVADCPRLLVERGHLLVGVVESLVHVLGKEGLGPGEKSFRVTGDILFEDFGLL